MPVKVFGASQHEMSEDLILRMKQLGHVVLEASEKAGFSYWELMSLCGTLYVNYLRDSEHREMAIVDAEALVQALKYGPQAQEQESNASH